MTNVNKCTECDGQLRFERGNAQLTVGTRRATVDVERFRCEACDEIVYTPEQMDAAQRAFAERVRADEGLLSPGEVRGIRQKQGLTQAEMETLLGVGAKTVVRWERGTVFQNRATDQLLRLIDAVPEALEFLAARNGVQMQKAGPEAQPPAVSRTLRFSIPVPIDEKRQAERRGAKRGQCDVQTFQRTQEKQFHFGNSSETALPPIPIEAMQ